MSLVQFRLWAPYFLGNIKRLLEAVSKTAAAFFRLGSKNKMNLCVLSAIPTFVLVNRYRKFLQLVCPEFKLIFEREISCLNWRLLSIDEEYRKSRTYEALSAAKWTTSKNWRKEKL